MYTIKKQIDKYNDIDFELIANKERLVFFDIETTGLSSAHSQLYLIGLLSYEEGSWQLIQYFAEDMFDEEALIESFSDFLRLKSERDGKLYLISYNGDNFDIPFLISCAKQYRKELHLDRYISLDLIKTVRSLRKMLGLPDCKLKTIERFLGISREDVFSGGELIELYREFCRLNAAKTDSDKSEALLKVLLLHNEEDIADMPALIQMLSYEALLEGEFEIESSRTVGDVVDIELKLSHKLPRELYIEEKPYVISVSQDGSLGFNFTAELCEAELKYFFPDYKEYYYLPAEDYAVHKSVGEFVDRKARKQATRKTAYIRKNGLFLEQPEEIYSPVFTEEYNSKRYYALFDSAMLENREQLKRYVLAALRALCGK